MDWVQFVETVADDMQRTNRPEARAALIQARRQVEGALTETEKKIENLNVTVRAHLPTYNARDMSRKYKELKLLCKRADRLRSAVNSIQQAHA